MKSVGNSLKTRVLGQISAYKMQFMGTITSYMHESVWRPWAPPKTKFFAWLANQNRVWTADRLAKRGWPNCGLCPFCKQTQESLVHLLVHCRFTRRVWDLIFGWLGLHNINTGDWLLLNFPEWWIRMTNAAPHRKAIASLTLLVTWEVWNERNARVFQNKSVPSLVLLEKVKTEARLWVLAGAKCLDSFIPRE